MEAEMGEGGIWTAEDENKYNQMRARRADTLDRQAAALLQTIKIHVPIKSGSVSDVSIYDLKNAMIENGGAFRDALAPFDHMGRQG